MSEQIRTGDYLDTIRDLESRVAILERTARVPNISTVLAGLKSSTIATLEGVTSTSYTDLATPGPSVQIQVPGTGRLLVFAAARISFIGQNHAGGDGGQVGYQVVGTLNGTLGPYDLIEMNITSLPAALNTIRVATSFIDVRESLTPETVTVSLKYKAINGGEAAGMSNRKLVVLPL